MLKSLWLGFVASSTLLSLLIFLAFGVWENSTTEWTPENIWLSITLSGLFGVGAGTLLWAPTRLGLFVRHVIAQQREAEKKFRILGVILTISEMKKISSMLMYTKCYAPVTRI